MESFKLRVEGAYETEEAAIKDLADQYMRCSHCDAPGDHPIELLLKCPAGDVKKICKSVLFSVKTKVFGRIQWVEKYDLKIYPFKENHWWPAEEFKFEPCEFRYKIIPETDE